MRHTVTFQAPGENLELPGGVPPIGCQSGELPFADSRAGLFGMNWTKVPLGFLSQLWKGENQLDTYLYLKILSFFLVFCLHVVCACLVPVEVKRASDARELQLWN